MNPATPDALEFSYLPDAAREILVSVNPKAGARSGQEIVEQLVGGLRARQFLVEVLTDPAQLSGAATAKMQAGTLRAVVAAGGDGTAALVCNCTPVGVPIMVLPLGTENLLAKYLHVAADPEAICRMIQDGATVQLDAGQANDQVFLLMVSCGFDAEVVRRVHENRAGHIRRWTYFRPILQAIGSYQFPELQLYCGGQAESPEAKPPVVARWAFVFNLPKYASGLGIAPWANGGDGQLDVCAFAKGSLWHGLRYLFGILRGRHHTFPDCLTFSTPEVRVTSGTRVPYQVDGDFAGYLPVEIRVLPKRLRVLVSKTWTPSPGRVSLRPVGLANGVASAPRCFDGRDRP